MHDAERAASLVVLRRAGAVLIAVGIVSSLGVYFGHEWFHRVLLPSLGIGSALGDALGGLGIIFVAFVAQWLASLALFEDSHFGLLRSAQRLEQANAELQAGLSALDQIASMDRLTGCWNRRGLEDAIRGEIERLARHGHSLSMLVVDADHFKSVNDRYGHVAGDRVLIQLAVMLRSCLRASDSLARWGGEEFIVVCPDTALTTAVGLAERLREKIGRARIEPVGSLTVSVGVAECLPGEKWQEWLDRADAALYRAKRSGRNQVQFAPETPRRQVTTPVPDNAPTNLSRHRAPECGHTPIGRDRQAAFAIGDDLADAIVSGKSLPRTS